MEIYRSGARVEGGKEKVKEGEGMHSSEWGETSSSTEPRSMIPKAGDAHCAALSSGGILHWCLLLPAPGSDIWLYETSSKLHQCLLEVSKIHSHAASKHLNRIDYWLPRSWLQCRDFRTERGLVVSWSRTWSVPGVFLLRNGTAGPVSDQSRISIELTRVLDAPHPPLFKHGS